MLLHKGLVFEGKHKDCIRPLVHGLNLAGTRVGIVIHGWRRIIISENRNVILHTVRGAQVFRSYCLRFLLNLWLRWQWLARANELRLASSGVFPNHSTCTEFYVCVCVLVRERFGVCPSKW